MNPTLGAYPIQTEVIRDIQEQVNHALETLITRSHLVLLQVRSIFPLDLWPDRMILDMSKVTIFSRQFLGLTTEHTIMLDEIRDVDLESNPICSTLRILITGPGGMWTSITNLRRQDAQKAKFILEGLIIARLERCNLEGLILGDLVQKLCVLGGGQEGRDLCISPTVQSS
jgi:hypothetical protein